uniref:Myb/SANT-like DNA-binding domain-containing protein n=1 Tax=Esox lucius TaxID=8010 RepID=A0AAY5KY12_ESOLU
MAMDIDEACTKTTYVPRYCPVYSTDYEALKEENYTDEELDRSLDTVNMMPVELMDKGIDDCGLATEVAKVETEMAEEVSQPSSMHSGVVGPWSLEETKALITIWSKEEILLKLKQSYRNKHVYSEISNLLNTLGFQRTWKQCKKKIRDLECSYRKALINPSSSIQGSCSLFSELRCSTLDIAVETGQVSDGEEMSLEHDEGPSVDVYLEDHQHEEMASSKVTPMTLATEQKDEIEGHEEGVKNYEERLHRQKQTDAVVKVGILYAEDVSQTSSPTVYLGRPWSLEETKELIAIWSDKQILQKLKKSYRKRNVYSEISKLLNNHGFKRTWKQCQTKIRDMKYSYRRALRNPSSGSSGSVTCLFFSELRSLLSAMPDDDNNEGNGQVSDGDEMFSYHDEGPSVDETRMLIAIWSNEQILLKFKQSYRNKHVYSEISKSLHNNGFKRTWKQCQTKIRDLKCSYRQALRNPKQTDKIKGHEAFHSPENDQIKIEGETHYAEDVSQISTMVYLGRPWTLEETKVLIAIWSKKEILQKLKQSYRKRNVYSEISKLLNNYGFKRTWKQCQRKIRDMKYSYRRALRNPSSSGSVTCSFYSELHTLLSTMPHNNEETGNFSDEEMSLDQDEGPSVNVYLEDLPHKEKAFVTENAFAEEPTEERKSDNTFQSSQSDKLMKIKESHCCLKLVDELSELALQSVKELSDEDISSTSYRVLNDESWTQNYKWTLEETQTLIAIWSNEEILKKLEQNFRNKHIYSEMSKLLDNHGFKRTWKQCQTKIRDLKYMYRRALRDPSSRVNFSFFSELHTFLSALVSRLTSTWSQKETKVLISIWSNEKILQKLERSYRKKPVYGEISERLNEHGFKRTWKQCQIKIKDLKFLYRRARMKPSNSRPSPFFAKLKEFLGDIDGEHIQLCC